MVGSKKKYIPDTGHIVWLQFDPQAGHEQAGHRPAIVLSPQAYNAKTSRMFCCPLTTKIKGYPFEVSIAGNSTPSVALADQLKCLDWKARGAIYKSTASRQEIQHIKQLIACILEL